MNALPDVKLRVMTPLPPSIRNGLGVNVEKKNGIYTFLLDYSDIDKKQSIPADEYPQTWQLFWNDGSGGFTLVPYTLPTAKVTGTSSTSNSVSTGTKNFSVESNIGWTVGTRLRGADATDPTTYIEGVVSSYDPATGALELVADRFFGSGDVANWSISVTGDHGSGDVTSSNYGSEYAADTALFRSNVGAVPGGSDFSVQTKTGDIWSGVALGIGASIAGRDSASPISTYHRGGVDLASVYGIDNTGAANVGAAIQAAIDVICALTPNAYLKAGTYDITGHRLRLPSNCNLMGDGSTFTVLKRADDSNTGTVEVFNAHNVRVTGIGIDYTPSTFTLGYGQTGFCARNGSEDVWFTDCSVIGKLNRQFHAFNSRNIRFTNCVAVGGGDAGIRVVSDPDAAASYPSVVGDETSPVPVKNIWITDCLVSGETALNNGTRSGLFYGISVASEASSAGTVVSVFVERCVVTYTNGQGVGFGAFVRFSHIKGCTISNIADGSSGVAILLVTAGSKSPMYIVVAGNIIFACYNGIYSVGSFYTLINGNMINGGNTGILLNGTTASKIGENCIDSCAADGISALGSMTHCTINDNNVIGCVGTGIKSDSSTSNIKFSGNRSYANGTNYSKSGTGHSTSDDTEA